MLNRWLDSSAESLRAVVLYLVVFVAFAMAVASVYSSNDSVTPLLAVLVLGGVGLVVAFQLRDVRGAFWIGLLLGALMVAMAAAVTPAVLLHTMPAESQMALYLVWITLCLTFTACSNDRVLFILVPSLALVIAGSTGSTEPGMTGYALIFCLSSVFALLCHAGIREMHGSPRSRLTLRQLILNQSTLAGLSFITTAALAVVVLVPVRLIGSALRPLLSGSVYPLRNGRSFRRSAQRPGTPTPAGAFTSGSTVDVGRGPVQPTALPVLILQSNQKYYLLSRYYTDYVNHGWSEGPADPSVLATPVEDGFVVQPDPYAAKWPVVLQRIQLLTPTDVAPAYSRLAAVRISGLGGGFELDGHGCIRLTKPVTNRLSYMAMSYVPPPFDGLTEGPSGGPRPPAPDPPLTSPRLMKLASSLKGRADIATVRNVIHYLQSHCTYDLNAPAVPAGSDAADFFVFESRAGYCDLFATSAAVLLQLAGVPTRYCTGYVPGKPDEGYNGNIVTAADGHAWVEVFIQGRGWITIDPTPPGFSGPSSLPVRLRGVLSELHLEPGTINFPVVALMIALAGCLPLLYRMLPTPRRQRASRRIGLEGDRSVIDYLTMLDLMARAGVKRRPYDTPYEFLARMRQCKLPAQIDSLAERLTDGFVSVRYAHESAPYDPAVIRQFREALNRKNARQILRALRTSAPRRKSGSGRRKEPGPGAALPVE